MFATLLLALNVAVASVASDGLPAKAPKAVGMSAERLAAIDRVVNRGLKAGGYPGAAVVVGRKGAAVWQRGFGRLGWTSSEEAVSPDRTIYDLASLTKVVGTTTAIMILFDEGRIALDAPVAQYLPAFSGGFKDSVTIRHLLTHRSGLPPGRDLWRGAHSAEEARAMVIETPLVCKPGQCYQYSDLGADVLGMVAEVVAAKPLDQFLEERVWQPLGMNDTFYRPADSLKVRIAPTEMTPPRGYPVRGEVHDENAYALGGVAGHAGLFSTAADLSIFAQMMLNKGEYNGVRIISDSTVELFTRRAAGSRALGWDTAEGGVGSGTYMSDHAYGHTGFTGTSIWIDPDREMFVVLLTNRVHAARARRPAKVISDVRNDLADLSALAVLDAPDGVLAMPAAFRADRAIGWNSADRSARRSRSTRGRSAARRTTSSRSSKKASSSKRTASSSKAKKPAAKSSSSAAKKKKPVAKKSKK
ncbi:MAG TPA: serine hydrolase [Gemmatimonadaceae bacterium]|nr:serine hydrolase [Gemmatimonadaceae bacterium]